MAVAEIVGLALVVATLLPMVNAGVEECRSLRDAPKELESFRRDLEAHHAILTIVKGALEEISSRPAGDQPQLASILPIAQKAWSDCNETAAEFKLILERTRGRFRAYFRGGKILGLHQKLTRRTVTLTALLQAVDRLDRHYPSEKIVERYQDAFKGNIAHNPVAGPPPSYIDATQTRPVNVQTGINWRRVGKIALWIILGAAIVIGVLYALPFLVTYFTGSAVATGLGVGATPTAMLPWTAASYATYATTLVSTLGNTAAASASGTAVAAATTAASMTAFGVTMVVQPTAAILAGSLGGIFGGWSALK